MNGQPPVPNALLELTKVRLREFLREKGVLFWVFIFPLLMAIGLGLAFRAKPTDLPRIAVVGAVGERSVDALLASRRVVARHLRADAARRELSGSKVDLLVEVAAGAVTYQFDRMQEKSGTARAVVDSIVQQAAGRRDPVPVRDVALTELGSRYIDYLLPGLIAMNLMGTSMWGVGYNLVIARKRKLLRRYAVTPMHRGQFLLSYFLSRSLFLVMEVSILVLFGRLVFGTVVQGNYLLLAAVAFLGAASFAGISLLVGARVDNTETANGWMNLVQLPMWVLSGTFFSYERFPEWLHLPIRLLPLTALADALRAVFNRGATSSQLLFELAVMATWGVAGYAVALRSFRWQ
jgi:ABC-type multidrug transport system permease subunit